MQRLGEYELQKELGRGATAKIYLARHQDNPAPVSLKVFHPRWFQDPQFSRRIRREIEVTSGLHHENIVRVREVLNSVDPPALVMDYIDGENLEKFQSRLPYILPEVSALIVIEILKGLEYAHAQGLIHRDLKPENVLISKDGRVLVTDFGLAKIQDTTMITQGNVILGSLDYMSPEQAKGDSVQATSDIFSTSVILYFLTTGTRPFSRSSTFGTLAAIREEAPEAAQKRNPKLSTEFCRLMQKGMEKKPEDRYQSAAEFRQALESYLDGIGLPASQFSLGQWIHDPSSVVLDALRTSVDRLILNCEKSLRAEEWDPFLEGLGHLSLKAPQSPAIARLTENYRRIKGKGRKAGLAFAAGVLICVSVPLLYFTRFAPTPVTTAAVVAPAPAPVTASAPVPARPVVEHPPVPTGMVRFNVGRGIRVYWDGREVNPKSILREQALGEHQITLVRPGFDPIRSTVRVKPDEPVVVNVR